MHTIALANWSASSAPFQEAIFSTVEGSRAQKHYKYRHLRKSISVECSFVSLAPTHLKTNCCEKHVLKRYKYCGFCTFDFSQTSELGHPWEASPGQPSQNRAIKSTALGTLCTHHFFELGSFIKEILFKK